MQKLSIIIPVFNEERFIDEALNRVLQADLTTLSLEKEVIVIDDGSTDSTTEKLKAYEHRLKVVYFPINIGKGAALRAGFKVATGDILVIQDADLEYDPDDYQKLLKPILSEKADVVYGSRFIGNDPHRVLLFWHYVANKFLTLVSNMFSNLNLTDIETGYKVFRADVIKSIQLQENRFGIEPELTIKLARKNWRFYEVGITYNGRTYAEGKKITWKDGLYAFWAILKHGFETL